MILTLIIQIFFKYTFCIAFADLISSVLKRSGISAAKLVIAILLIEISGRFPFARVGDI